MLGRGAVWGPGSEGQQPGGPVAVTSSGRQPCAALSVPGPRGDTRPRPRWQGRRVPGSVRAGRAGATSGVTRGHLRLRPPGLPSGSSPPCPLDPRGPVPMTPHRPPTLGKATSGRAPTAVGGDNTPSQEGRLHLACGALATVPSTWTVWAAPPLPSVPSPGPHCYLNAWLPPEPPPAELTPRVDPPHRPHTQPQPPHPHPVPPEPASPRAQGRHPGPPHREPHS